MPGPAWLYLVTLVVLGFVLNTLTFAATMFVAARICRIKRLWIGRAAIGGAIMAAFCLLLALLMLLTSGLWATPSAPTQPYEPPLPAARELLMALASLMGMLAAWFVVLRKAGGAGLGRTSLALLVSFVIGGVVGWPMVLMIHRFAAHAFRMPTASMAPTLVPGDHILVDPRRFPDRWQLIAFYAPHQPSQIYVKRLIGLPGETVEIVDGEIHINGVVLAKPPALAWLRYDGTGMPGAVFIKSHTGCTGSPITLGRDEYYVLGDNTEASLDSRFWDQAAPGHQLGAVPRSMIVGTVRALYAPRSRMRTFN
jgi:signal peptidase I